MSIENSKNTLQSIFKPLRKLPNDLLPVKPIDLSMLPKVIEDFARDISTRQQSPADFVVISTLCAIAGIVGRKAQIKPKQKDDWTITPTLWGLIIGAPSSMKSPTLNEAIKPLKKLESDAKCAHDRALIDYEAEREVCKLMQDAAKKGAKDSISKGNKDEAMNKVLVARNSEPDQPTRARLIVNDSTVEKLGELLNQNSNGLLLVRDELSGWLAQMQQEEHQGDRAFYLECFNGDSRYTYDRIGRGTIDIEHCIISIIGGIQPSKLSPIVRAAVNGQADDGLVQRFQLAIWPDVNSEPKWKDQAPCPIIKAAYEKVISDLNNLENLPAPLNFSMDAQATYIEWYEGLQKKIALKDTPETLQSHMQKMPKTCASLALLFELIEGNRDQVSDLSTLMAIELMDYLESHMHRIYGLALSIDVINANLILKRKHKLNNPFTLRELQQKGWSGLNNGELCERALTVLEEHGYIASIEVTYMLGGRPSIQYYFNNQIEVEII